MCKFAAKLIQLTMKKLLLLLLITSTSALADPDLSSEKKYHIVCTQFSDGCVTDGATAKQNTPIYYLTNATKGEETYWNINSEGNGNYSIQNAKTGKYITYDGVRQDSPQLLRYLNMTDQKDGDNSLWRFVMNSEGIYAIRNVQQTDHLWDVRVDSYCVGTYSQTGNANANQLFMIFDSTDNQVFEKVEEDPETAGLFSVSSWLEATTELYDGWSTSDSQAWSDPGFGDYHNGSASIVSPFLERWNDSSYGPLADNTLSQTLNNLPQGDYRLMADVIAVRQANSGWWNSTPEEVGYGVYLFAGEEQTECGTSDEQPERYITDFTVSSTGTVTLGLRILNTNANWVATDNFELYFKGTKEELIAGEKAKVRTELADYLDEATIEASIADCNDDFEALETLRHSADDLPTLDPLARALSDLTINGQSLAWVESIQFYLVSTSEDIFGNDYTATIDYTSVEGWDSLMINGKTVAPGESYTFTKVTASKGFSLTVRKTDGTKSISKRITFTALPVVKLYGTFNDYYSNGTIQVMEPDMGYMPEILNMKAKWRGGITNSNGKHKRNYHVKLQNELGSKLERKFFGLRNDNSWILESCQVDMSRIRNRVLTDLWNDYSTPPYHIAQDNRAMTGTRGQFVELVLNDEYRGIYCMTENMDRKQLKLKKIDEAADENSEPTVHGQLWKSKDWSYATLMGTRPDGGYTPKDYLSDPSQYSEMWDSYQVKYPDFEDYGNQTDWSVLYDAVDFVCHSSDEDFKAHIAEYFDLPLVIDYYILMETILATDNHGKNMFFAVYDKQVDKKITFAVWDMDATCGQRWSDQYYHWNGMQPEQDYATYIARNEHGDYNLFKRLRDTDADDFNMRVRMRYRDLRKDYLNTDSILKRFSTYLNRFKKCGAAAREYNRWNGDSDIAGYSLNFDTEMTYITDWFTRRMNYLDTTRFDIESLPADGPIKGDVNGDGTVNVADISALISFMAGDEGSISLEVADVNADGSVNVADISYVISIMAGE